MDANKDERRTLPSIDQGNEVKINNINPNSHIIIDEKVDGSQLTIRKLHGILHYYNKNKEINPMNKCWRNAWICLQNKADIFEEGLWYHGEAFTTRQTNVNEYDRCPKNCWIVYEVVRPNNSILTPEEMHELIKDTGLETVQLLYNNRSNINEKYKNMKLQDIINSIMDDIENGIIKSCLGNNKPEGIVVKVLNNYNKKENKISNTRYKYVRKEFMELHQQKREKIQEVPDNEYIKEIGTIYNVNPRFQKAIQHLKEQNRWNYDDPMKNIQALVDELDKDLLKEALDDIKNMLIIRFWNEISKNARRDLVTFLTNFISENHDKEDK